MEHQFNHIEQIDQYLTNKMSVVDRLGFQKELESNEGLRLELDNQQMLRDVVITSSLDDIRSMMNADFEKQTKVINNKPKYFTLVGLSVLTVIGGYFFWNSEDEKRPVNKTVVESVVVESPDSRESGNALIKNIERTEVVEKVNEKPAILKYNKQSVEDNLPDLEEDSVSDIKREVVSNIALTDLKIDDQDDELVLLDVSKEEEKLEDVQQSAPLTFKGKVNTVSSSSQASTGKIIIKGQVTGGKQPYRYFIYEDAPQTSTAFKGLETGDYIVYAIDNDNEVIPLQEVHIDESLCVLDYNESFVPSYDVSWEIPVVSDNDFDFKVYGMSGIVYEHHFDSNEDAKWLGKNLSGQMLNTGYYRFEINYGNGEQCLGEITIGN